MDNRQKETEQTEMSQIFGLLICCPFGDAEANCPLTTLRETCSLEEKFLKAKQIAGQRELMTGILDHHDACLAQRAPNYLPGHYRSQQRSPGKIPALGMLTRTS